MEQRGLGAPGTGPEAPESSRGRRRPPSGTFHVAQPPGGRGSALYHVTNDIEIVKRWGRWTSQAFNRYLWDRAEQAKDFAKGMAKDDAAINYS